MIKKAKLLDISPITSFVNGIERDKDAVINAMSYTLSNGLVEASVNKVKKVKRIMNGRCNFKTWRTCILALSYLQ